MAIYRQIWSHRNTKLEEFQDAAEDNAKKSWEWKKTQLILFTKLFVIMGLSWLSECIHFKLHGDHSDLHDCNVATEVKIKDKLRNENAFSVIRWLDYLFNVRPFTATIICPIV